MSFKKPDINYWNNKFTAYMHDPFDKMFGIKGHEQRAQELINKYGLIMPNDKFWRTADGIASGFERGQVPSHSNNENINGYIDFFKNPFISHPTSSEGGLKIVFNEEVNPERVWSELIEFIDKAIGTKAGSGGYSDNFKGDENSFAIARFLYTHLVLRFKLAENNVGGIGALWHRLPADSRFPDHSIWQHNQLTSAIYSCMELGEGDNESRKDNIGLMVFSIAPVQPFIAKARKLRDYWSGSVLLSYLAFEGIRWIIENLGPDHVVYPSLIDQPLVSEYLRKKWGVKGDFEPEIWKLHDKTIASFPNKFLFFVPFNYTKDIACDIENHIKDKWVELGEIVFKKVLKKVGIGSNSEESDYLHRLFERQISKYWDIQWSAVRLVGEKDIEEVSNLLAKQSYEKQVGILEIFNKIIEHKKNYEKAGKGVLYSVSHSLVQSALAAEKARKVIKREEEPGEKCQMCGESEVLHTKEYKDDISAREYKENINEFWKKLEEEWKDTPDFKENERLCSVCLIKRIIGEALRDFGREHILNSVFKSSGSFPSTTMVALYDYYKRKGIEGLDEQKAIAQKLYESKDDEYEDIKNRDKYYAILLMDGDKMGELINGQTFGSKWETIMHPEIVERLKKPNFSKEYRENWKKIFKDYKKRILTPSIHAAISESLGDFAMYGVSKIIRKYNGRLIYAGGDDVCAIMPVGTVLDAADEIRRYYKSSFRLVDLEGNSEEIKESFSLKQGKLSINLGNGEKDNDKISISAGILICHHKENLSEMIKRAHGLLDEKAKEEAGRNACAIELRKRSGGSRYFVRKWDDEKAWESFKKIGGEIRVANKAGREDKDKSTSGLSKSLVYRLNELEYGINAILKVSADKESEALEKFITKQVERTKLNKHDDDKNGEIARNIINVCRNGDRFEAEGLIVAGFIYGGESYV